MNEKKEVNDEEKINENESRLPTDQFEKEYLKVTEKKSRPPRERPREFDIPRHTLERDKHFQPNRNLNKEQLFAKIVELMGMHLEDIPMEIMRTLFIFIDLLAHRRQIKR